MSDSEELRALPARIAAAAVDERRTIERQLHDGPLQQLVALGVGLQLAEELLERDLAAARLQVEEMRSGVHEALDELRQLCWRIYPSLLLDRGLVEAVRAAAAEAPIPTRVEASALGRHAPEVEAAVYFVCAEALAEGAGAGARVRLREDSGQLCFDVLVAGGDWSPGEFAAARDRVAALGGRLTVSSGTVSGSIPISA
jgi:signal transduction histidine kinase